LPGWGDDSKLSCRIGAQTEAGPIAVRAAPALTSQCTLVLEAGLPYRAASERLWREHHVRIPWATIQDWVEAHGCN
jgi:hypothetical protein